jgi:hypothetical protein
LNPVDEDDCASLEEGDCIQITGEVVNFFLVSGFSMSSFSSPALVDQRRHLSLRVRILSTLAGPPGSD